MLELININKSFGNNKVIDTFSLKVEEGDFISIVGKSGSGKSTLLNIIGLIDNYDSGEYRIEGQAAPKANSKAAELIIRNKISYLFQNFALIDEETVFYNLSLALEYTKNTRKEKEELIGEVLTKVGLEGFSKRKVFELSGGEQQRVSLARAIIKPSSLILADEPTGSLDDMNKNEIFSLLREANKLGKAIIMVSHDEELAEKTHRVVRLA